MIILYHLTAFILGFIIDLLVGDPYKLPHPIRAIGSIISFFENKMLGNRNEEKNITPEQKRCRGCISLICILLLVTLTVLAVVVLAYFISPYFGCAIEAVMTWQILAVKSLRTESMKVYKALNEGTVSDARRAVSMIVGRDTEHLDEKQVARAAVETVAENASDGVIAPMLYLAIGGPVAGFFYKTINTCDSMLGYKNDRFIDFGRASAKFDDVVNFLPSRISAVLMIISCFFLGSEFDGKRAAKIWKRDRRNHASPNSAQTESACAGALGLRLAGDTSYFGKMVKKPFIGDAIREIETDDIKRANRLMYMTAFLCELICVSVMVVLCFVFI